MALAASAGESEGGADGGMLVTALAPILDEVPAEEADKGSLRQPFFSGNDAGAMGVAKAEEFEKITGQVTHQRFLASPLALRHQSGVISPVEVEGYGYAGRTVGTSSRHA